MQQPVTAMLTLGKTVKQQNLEIKNGKKNNYMDTLSECLMPNAHG